MNPRLAILSSTLFAGTVAGAAVFAAVGPLGTTPDDSPADAGEQVTVVSPGLANEAQFVVAQPSFEEDEYDEDQDDHDGHDDGDHHHDHDHHDSDEDEN